ncbi:hypothetical protein EPA93_12300 [Ktedonosporobacter rubrisoli]|uniref:Uncharacterized protein n=1 Tax=Ktedonosporobacter rubrisoli TaxID=2509675 RepID=A0A4P6JNA1_KTERU|nr:general stress protein [Ktedonosporobacter rubrisoli]QBD76744.1 hypothetical protein EPA93_12300 [Ktedonosporobacter rubrisoli]
MTTTQRTTVVGVFSTRRQAEDAINELQRAGFTNEQIGFLVKNGEQSEQDLRSTAPGEVTNAAVGAVSGGVIGGIVGAAAALFIPGIGPAVAGGILATTLGGAAVGAVAGGLLGVFSQMGIPEEEARYYQGEFEAGRALVTVTAPNRQAEALDILQHNGASTSTRPDAYNANQAGAYRQPVSDTYTQPGQYDPRTAPSQTYSQPGTYTNPETPYQDEANTPRTYDPNANRPYDPNDPAVRRTYESNNPNVPYTERPYDPNDPNARRTYEANNPDFRRTNDPNVPYTERPYDPNDTYPRRD